MSTSDIVKYAINAIPAVNKVFVSYKVGKKKKYLLSKEKVHSAENDLTLRNTYVQEFKQKNIGYFQEFTTQKSGKLWRKAGHWNMQML